MENEQIKQIINQMEVIDSKIVTSTDDINLAKELGNNVFANEKKDLIVLKYVIVNNEVTCYILNSNNKILSVGSAYCHNDDEFSLFKGMNLAELRAKKNMYEYFEGELLKEL